MATKRYWHRECPDCGYVPQQCRPPSEIPSASWLSKMCPHCKVGLTYGEWRVKRITLNAAAQNTAAKFVR